MTLHRRGLGRDEIFALLARDYEDAFRAALWPTVTGKGTGAERLEAMLVAVCEVTEDHLDFLAALDEESDRRFFHESDDEVHSREGYINPIERLLADGIADGSLRQVEIEETATVLVNATDRTYRHLRRAHDWDAERSRGALIDLMLRGLLPAVPSLGEGRRGVDAVLERRRVGRRRLLRLCEAGCDLRRGRLAQLVDCRCAEAVEREPRREPADGVEAVEELLAHPVRHVAGVVVRGVPVHPHRERLDRLRAAAVPGPLRRLPERSRARPARRFRRPARPGSTSRRRCAGRCSCSPSGVRRASSTSSGSPGSRTRPAPARRRRG